jgi:hypothetical protein
MGQPAFGSPSTGTLTYKTSAVATQLSGVATADEYIGALNTYSGHRALDDDTRERLLARIHQRVEARPGGKVSKTYLAMLNVAEPYSRP